MNDMHEPSPNHALQRTGAAVTPAASCLRLSPTAQRSRQPRPSLSLGSLGVAAHIPVTSLMTHRPFQASFIAAALFFSIASARAGGSISFQDDAIPLLRRQPALLQFVQQTLDISPTGWGLRLGHDFGDRVGTRVPPFRFEARPKGQKGPYTLLLIINDPDTGFVDGKDTSTTSYLEIHPLTAKKP